MIYDDITTLIAYAITHHLIDKLDKAYMTNRILKLLKLDEYNEGKVQDLELHEILNNLIRYAVDNNIIQDSQNARDEFDTEIMGTFVDRPSNIINTFYSLYNKDKKEATNYFYNLQVDSNYIRKDRIIKDIKWQTETEYGTLDITINLSKPEKDPKDIAAALNQKAASYPKCALCKENEGYKGRINHPARSNIRLIPITLDNHQYYLQYSPYVYYNEHCIVLDEDHKPMVINRNTFKALLDFVDLFPHYFIGSNADLPIVGGSILTHNHFQGGSYIFPICHAEELEHYNLGNVDMYLVKWPLSTLRLRSANKDELLDVMDYILNKWINYEDLDANIIPFTDGIRHNTITPIVRKQNDMFEVDLILRNNLTSDKYPMGIYHPHPEYHHIKKENIGLIEAIGLAILPSRLKNELNIIKDAILNKKDLDSIDVIKSHLPWLKSLLARYDFSENNIDEILKKEIGLTFKLILEDAGVFKQTEEGLTYFKKFIKTL